MSWDVYVARWNADLVSVSEEIDAPLGTGPEVRTVLQRTLPGLVFGDDTWADVDGDGYGLSLHVADNDEPIDVLALRFVGGGSAAADTAMRIADAFGARASSGDGFLVDATAARRSLAGWAQYRTFVVGTPQPEA